MSASPKATSNQLNPVPRPGMAPALSMLHRVFIASRLPALAALVLLPLGFGVYVLGNHATRDWSYHWPPARTLVASAAPPTYAAAGTANGGFDVLSVAGSGNLWLSHFARDGSRIGGDVTLTGSPSTNAGSMALARAGNLDVAAWREDAGSGSRLQIAVVRAGSAPVYHNDVAIGSPLEHVQAFAVGNDVDVVYTWLRSTNDAYLVHVGADGTSGSPVQLTHASVYAFVPHGMADSASTFRLIYLDQCCGASGFHVVTARYSVAGRPLGPASRLDEVPSAPALVGTTVPAEWGLDMQRLGSRVWAAWTGHGGLKVASWAGARLVLPPQTAVSGGVSLELALALDAGHQSLVWKSPGPSGALYYVRMDASGLPLGDFDRITFASGFHSLPQAVTTGDTATLLYASGGSIAGNADVKASKFSPATLGAPDLSARLGLGLTNPFAALATLFFGALALGALITIGNILFLIVVSAVYLLVARLTPERGRWLVFAAVIAVILGVVVGSMGAPTPPMIAISGLLGGFAALLLFVAAGIFAYLLQWVALRRTDELFRGGAMVAAGFFFLAFLQALTIVQGEL